MSNRIRGSTKVKSTRTNQTIVNLSQASTIYSQDRVFTSLSQTLNVKNAVNPRIKENHIEIHRYLSILQHSYDISFRSQWFHSFTRYQSNFNACNCDHVSPWKGIFNISGIHSQMNTNQSPNSFFMKWVHYSTRKQ